MIGKSGERGSRISVLAAGHHDDDDDDKGNQNGREPAAVAAVNLTEISKPTHCN